MKRRATALLAALVLTAGVAAGCGGSEEESNGSAGSGAQGTTQEAPQGAPAGIEDFQTCLAEQGVEVPAPGAGDGAPPGDNMSEEDQKAFEACQDELPEGLPPRGPPDTQPQ